MDILISLISFISLEDPEIQSALQNLVLLVISVLGTVVTAGITVASKKALKWLDGKSHAATFQCAVSKIETVTKNAVDEVEQTLVRQLKAEEKWDGDTAKQARDTAVDIAKRHLGDQGIKELSGCMGHTAESMEGMFRTYVEKHVRNMGSTGNESPLVAMGK